MMTAGALLASSVIGELPGWGLNTLSVGSLIVTILAGLLSSKLWTSAQVTRLIQQQDAATKAQTDAHAAAMSTNNEVWRALRDDAIRREGEWRTVATEWQKVATTLADGLDPLHEQGQAMLTIVQELQRTQRVRGGR